MKYAYPMVFQVCFERLIGKLTNPFGVFKSWFLCWLWGIDADAHVRFGGATVIRTRRRGEIVVGKGSGFNADFKNNLVGLVGPTVLDTRFGGKIVIGSRSGFSSVVISSKTLVQIGNDVKVGGNVRIFDHDFHSLEANVRRTAEDRLSIRSRPVIIGDDCFIGTNAILLKGTELGDRTIVAAGSVVAGLKTPPDSLVRGNPAAIVERC